MLKDLLSDLGVTGYWLAKRAGLSRQRVYELLELEDLSPCSYGTLRKIADTLGYLSVDELVRDCRREKTSTRAD